MKKRNVRKVILIVLAVLLAPIVLPILAFLLLLLLVSAVDSYKVRQCRQETLTQFYEQREKLEQTVTTFEKFPCGSRGFFTMGETYGYFYCPDDSCDDFFKAEPERSGRGYEYKYSCSGVDYWDYAEKICDDWYFYREIYNY